MRSLAAIKDSSGCVAELSETIAGLIPRDRSAFQTESQIFRGCGTKFFPGFAFHFEAPGKNSEIFDILQSHA
jgi:hypothetical protein